MKRVRFNPTKWCAAVWSLWAFCAAPADDQTNGPSPDASAAPLQVLSVRIGPDARVYVNDRAVEDEALTNELARLSQQADVVAFQSRVNPVRPEAAESKMMERLLALGRPLMIVEQDDSMTLSPEALKDRETSSVNLSSEHMLKIMELGETGRSNASSRKLPTLRLGLDSDEQTKSYELRRIELGLPGQKLWIVHDQIEEDETTTGIQLKTSF